MEKHIHIPIEGIEGHITWTGDEPPSKEVLFALTEMAKLAYKQHEITPKQLEQKLCKHKWKETHSGYCLDCKKCGLKI